MYPDHYWEKDRNAPFAFFLEIVDTYCHPESGMGVEELTEWAKHSEPPDEGKQFKDEFRRLLLGELDKLPEYALFTAAQYADGSDEAYLHRLWRELYGDEPVQSGESVP